MKPTAECRMNKGYALYGAGFTPHRSSVSIFGVRERLNRASRPPGEADAAGQELRMGNNAQRRTHERFRVSQTPGVREAATIAAVGSYHTAIEEVGPIAAAARARALLLTHIVPPTADPGELVLEAGRGFAGPVIAGEDLLSVDLATGTLAWRGLAARLGDRTGG